MTYSKFLNYYGANDVSQERFAFILVVVFEYIKTVYEIDVDVLLNPTVDALGDPVPAEGVAEPLQYAIFEHTRWIHKATDNNIDMIASVTDAAGNKVTYRNKLPKAITSIYHMYSPVAPALI